MDHSIAIWLQKAGKKERTPKGKAHEYTFSFVFVTQLHLLVSLSIRNTFLVARPSVCPFIHPSITMFGFPLFYDIRVLLLLPNRIRQFSRVSGVVFSMSQVKVNLV